MLNLKPVLASAPAARLTFRIIASLSLACALGFSGTACTAQEFRPGPNIALGCHYTLSPKPNYRYCTDGREATKLTDGVYSTGYFWTQKTTVGWTNARPALITVDLGEDRPICGASFDTAAGVAGVDWPVSIKILVSDDGKEWWPAGDLIALGDRHGSPPASGYAVHRYWTDELRAHGRYVAFQVDPGGPFTFCDEVEVYGGSPDLLRVTRNGEPVRDLNRRFLEERTVSGVRARVRRDTAAVRREVGTAPVTPERRASLLAELDAAERDALGWTKPAGFKAILPYCEAHRRILAVRAACWRSFGQRPAVWQTGRWDPIGPADLPPDGAASPSIDLTLLRGDVRGAVLNVTWPGEHPLRLRVSASGLPGGSAPAWLAVRRVAWTGTAAGGATASALLDADRDRDGWSVEIPSGMTCQLWLSVDAARLAPGLHRGNIALSAGRDVNVRDAHPVSSCPSCLKIALSAGRDLDVRVPCAIHVSRIRMPARPSLSLGGWDYTDAPVYGITPANRDQTVKFLRSYGLDAPWAQPQTMPFGKHEATGAMVQPPDTAAMDRWLACWKGARFFFVFVSVDGDLPDTEAARRKVSDWICFWARHVESRGVRPSQLGVLLVDEPGDTRRSRAAISWAKAIRQAQPDVIVFEDPTWSDPRQATPGLYENSTMLCPNRLAWIANRLLFEQVFLAQQRAGKLLAFYSCSGPARAMDPYSYYRLQAWDCFRYGAVHEGFWAFGDTGGGSAWNEFEASGAGYTPQYLGPEGCVTSKQMEAIREGREDYETLTMLRQAAGAADAGRQASAVADARALLQDGLVQVTEAPGERSIRWEDAKDRSTADRVRLSAIRLLESLAP
jgi:hypothetical protein